MIDSTKQTESNSSEVNPSLFTKYFDKKRIIEGAQILSKQGVSVSFSKGTPKTYFIISGIISDIDKYETKVKYKAKDDGQGEVTSNCTCQNWNKEDHCSHSVALFLYFHYQFEQNEQWSSTNQSSAHSGMGMRCKNYGTFISHPTRLIGSHPRSTYASSQYSLINNKLINFPEPVPFEGKIRIYFYPGEKADSGLRSSNYNIRFSLIRDNEEETKEISLFEYLYLFDWKIGQSYSLNESITNFLRKVKNITYALDMDIFINLAKLYCPEDIEGFYVNSTPIPLENICAPRINLSSVENKKYLRFNLQFTEAGSSNLAFMPLSTLVFAFNNGLLQHYKKKAQAYDYIDHLKSLMLDEESDLRTPDSLLPYKVREQFKDQLDAFLRLKSEVRYNSEDNKFYIFDSLALRNIFKNLLVNFQSSFFRFSFYKDDSFYIDIPNNQIWTGISAFYNSMKNYEVEILFNNSKLQTWSSTIQFERNKSDLDWFNINFNISEHDLEVIKNANLANNISFANDKLVILNKEQRSLAQLMKKYVDASEDKENISVQFYKSRIFELFELKKLGVDGALTDEEVALCEKLTTLEGIPEYEMSEKIAKTLRPYQKVGYNWLRFLHENKLGACLADDMGLGKTLQTISFLEGVIDQVDRVLIVCPVSILMNWQSEIEKFSELKAVAYYGDQREFDPNAKIIITSYGLLKREINDVFSKFKFDVLVLDEVHHLKNPRSLGAFAARQIKVDFRITLTGTPVENDISEFYNILDLSVPGIWGYAGPGTRKKAEDQKYIAKRCSKPFILRRTKPQVLTDLPPKEENLMYLNFSEEEKQNYLKTLLRIKTDLEGANSGKKYGYVLEGLLRLRQLCLWQQDIIQSTKIKFLLETVEQIMKEGHQAIIFSQFTTYLNLIETHFNNRHWKFSRIDGSQSIKKRQTQVDQFQSGKTPLFLISLKAGGVGLNLTAANYVFIMDPWWNPAVENQAIDRAHRIGQKNKLFVYKPIIKDSVEEKVLYLQNQKRKLFKELMQDDDKEAFSGKLTMDDFMFLLS